MYKYFCSFTISGGKGYGNAVTDKDNKVKRIVKGE